MKRETECGWPTIIIPLWWVPNCEMDKKKQRHYMNSHCSCTTNLIATISGTIMGSMYLPLLAIICYLCKVCAQIQAWYLTGNHFTNTSESIMDIGNCVWLILFPVWHQQRKIRYQEVCICRKNKKFYKCYLFVLNICSLAMNLGKSQRGKKHLFVHLILN